MQTPTYKTSTIFVSTGRRTRVFRSMKEVPAPLRKRLNDNLSGPNCRTLIVADRRGREYLVQALKSMAAGQASSKPSPDSPSAGQLGMLPIAAGARLYWREIMLICSLGLAGWSLFFLQ